MHTDNKIKSLLAGITATKKTVYISLKYVRFQYLGDVMNYKDSRFLSLVLVAIIFILVYIKYKMYLPLGLLILFITVKCLEDCSIIKIDNSKKTKGACYGGLGFVGFLDAIGILDPPGHISASIYVATMCFMEFIDLCLDRKKPGELDNKKHSEALDKIQNTRSKKARIAKTHKKA
ncbi:MAG: hypothetical protein Q8910_12915 [Bacteroidota bacterium]|nr:hypothetical protein [Bacteroidota bacterium]